MAPDIRWPSPKVKLQNARIRVQVGEGRHA
jgi:hypothetical protein